jgi:hypothetical protein
VLFFVLLFAMGNLVRAQEHQWGIKAGANYSSIVGDLTEGLKFRFSGHGGVFLNMRFTDKFALQPELLYSSQGFQFSTDLAAIQGDAFVAGDNDFRNNVQLNFITVPLVAQFALNDKVAVEVGPQFGFLLNQVNKIKNLDEMDPVGVARRTTINGDFQLDYGAVLGLAFGLNDHFSLSPRAYIGMRNRLNGLSGLAQNYNVALQLSLNYTF